jgi:hypothetical protein
MRAENTQKDFDELMQQLHQEYGQEQISRFCEYANIKTENNREELTVFTTNSSFYGY